MAGSDWNRVRDWIPRGDNDGDAMTERIETLYRRVIVAGQMVGAIGGIAAVVFGGDGFVPGFVIGTAFLVFAKRKLKEAPDGQLA